MVSFLYDQATCSVLGGKTIVDLGDSLCLATRTFTVNNLMQCLAGTCERIGRVAGRSAPHILPRAGLLRICAVLG